MQVAWNIKAYFLGKIGEIFQNVVCWFFYPACTGPMLFFIDCLMLLHVLQNPLPFRPKVITGTTKCICYNGCVHTQKCKGSLQKHMAKMEEIPSFPYEPDKVF